MYQFRVYVIELSDTSLYVGSTAHAIRVRYAQHRAGGRLASRACRRLGVKRLRPDLYTHLSAFLTRERVEREETKLARRLQRQGYRVHGGNL